MHIYEAPATKTFLRTNPKTGDWWLGGASGRSPRRAIECTQILISRRARHELDVVVYHACSYLKKIQKVRLSPFGCPVLYLGWIWELLARLETFFLLSTAVLIRTAIRHRAIPTLSGRAFAYRCRSLPRILRHRVIIPHRSSKGGSFPCR